MCKQLHVNLSNLEHLSEGLEYAVRLSERVYNGLDGVDSAMVYQIGLMSDVGQLVGGTKIRNEFTQYLDQFNEKEEAESRLRNVEQKIKKTQDKIERFCGY